jgi:hypothetical protein
MSVETKDWGCPKKIKARSETIIDAYRSHYGRESIPTGSQYWTMCGRCSHGDGVLGKNVEPDQIIKSNLAKPEQIHGVEIDLDVFNGNKSIKCGITWHCGDFLETMKSYKEKGNFKPAIVNADLVVMHKKASSYIAGIMRVLASVPGDILLISNIVLQYRSHESSIYEMVEALNKHRSCMFALDVANWSQWANHYEYNGTGKTRTKMGTIILAKSNK